MKFEASAELTQYFKEIESTSEPLSKAEEETLIPLAQQGNQQALNRVVNSCAKMVVKTTNKYMGQGVSVMDLVQEGNMGTIEALNRFKPGKSSFSSYAYLWISKYINDSVATVGRLVRLPMNKEFEIFKLKKAGEEVQSQTQVSLDKKLDEGSSATIGDMLQSTDADEKYQQEYVLEKAAQLLLKIPTPRDREIVKAYFGIGRFCAPSADSLSEEFGMSKVGINKVVKKSIELLRA